MADLIDRDALLQDMTKRSEGIADWHVFDVINEQPAVNRWIPCSEKRPDLWGEYLTYNAENGAMYVLTFSPAYNTFGIYDGNVTHWMSLPEKPEDLNRG